MAQKLNVPIIFNEGVGGGEHPFVSTRFEHMINARVSKDGSITKRYGTKRICRSNTSAHNDSSVPATPASLIPYGDSSVWIGGNKLYTRSYQLNTSQNGKRVYVDKVPEAVAELDGVATGAASYSTPDVAYGGGYFVYVYLELAAPNVAYGAVRSKVVDATTGHVILDDVVVDSTATRTTPKVVIIGTTAFCFYGSTTDTNVRARTLNLTTMTTSSNWSAAATPLSTSVNYNATWGSLFDVCVAGSLICVFYQTTSGTNRYIIETLDSSLNLDNSTAISETSTVIPSTVCVEYDTIIDAVWVAYSYTSIGVATLRFARFDVGQVSEDVTPQTIITGGSADIIQVSLTAMGNGDNCACIFAQSNSSLVAVLLKDTASYLATSAFQTYGRGRLVGRSFLSSGKVYAPFIPGDQYYSDSTQRTIFLGEFNMSADYSGSTNPVRPIVTLNTYRANGQTVDSVTSTLCRAVQIDSTTWVQAVDRANTPLESDNASISKVVWKFAQPFFGVQVNGVLMMTGGVPCYFDGASVQEVGFLTQLPKITVAVSAGSGALSAGNYQAIVCRARKDAQGNIHRSTPSVASNVVTVAANDRITYTWQNAYITRSQDYENNFANRIVNELYRTTVGSTTYRRVTTYPPNSAYLNSVSAATGTITEGVADSTILTYPELYTTGGVLDNVPPPSSKFVAFHRNRIWYAGTPDDTIWYSKTILPNEGPAFNEALTIQSFGGGRVTGIASLEDYLVIFKKRSIWVVFGDGADDFGENSQLTEPKQVSAELGCTDARSICVTPQGVYFLSERGIYFMERGSHQLIFIGKDVQNITQASGFTIYSTVLVPDQSQIRFACNGATTLMDSTPQNHHVLVYDTLHKMWSTYEFYDTTSSTYTGPRAACLANGVYNWVTSGGQEYDEDKTTYKDDGSEWVRFILTTGWLRLSELQNYQKVSRLQILGDRHTYSAWKVYEYTDYYGLYADASPTTYDTSTIAVSNPVQFEYGVIWQRCQAIKFEIFEQTPQTTTGTGQGITITGMNLLAYMMRGKWRPEPSRRV